MKISILTALCIFIVSCGSNYDNYEKKLKNDYKCQEDSEKALLNNKETYCKILLCLKSKKINTEPDIVIVESCKIK